MSNKMDTKENSKEIARLEKEIKKQLKKNPFIKSNPPKLLSIALSEMDKIVWIQMNEDLPADKMAFATRTDGGVYKVFVNNKIPEVYRDHFYLHEFGHVLFGHLKDFKLQEKQFSRKLLQSWSKIEPHLELTPEEAKMSREELANRFIIPMTGLLSNYATDMEVNSKLFSKDEWQEMLEITDDAFIRAKMEEGGNTLEFLTDVLKRVQGDENRLTKPIWPEDYGFDIQLSYHEYLDLIFQNIDKFMNFLRQDAQNQPGQGQGQSQSQEQGSPSQSSQSGNGQGDSQGQGQDQGQDQDGADSKEKGSEGSGDILKKLSLKDIEELRKAANKSDMDTTGNEEAAEKVENGKSGGDDDSDSVGDSSGTPTGRGSSGLGFGHTGQKEIFKLENGKTLSKFLLKEVFSKKVENVRVNEMYYYNRRKYGDKDIIAKYTKENVYRPGNIYIIIDCSGSVEAEAIGTIMDCTRTLAKKCGPKSRVIWWDTSLCGDIPIRKATESFSGGGTDIAPGIAYVKEHYLKSSNDKLIIVSDFQDTLSNWYDEVKDLRNDVVGICWTTYQPSSNLESFIEEANYGYNASFDPKKFLNKIHTRVVQI